MDRITLTKKAKQSTGDDHRRACDPTKLPLSKISEIMTDYLPLHTGWFTRKLIFKGTFGELLDNYFP